MQGRSRGKSTTRRYFPDRCRACRYGKVRKDAAWFLARIHVEGDCWIWTGARTRAGYALYGTEYLHRLVFHRYYGFWPVTVDHLCYRPPCLNPRHMESVTLSENIRRAWVHRRLS